MNENKNVIDLGAKRPKKPIKVGVKAKFLDAEIQEQLNEVVGKSQVAVVYSKSEQVIKNVFLNQELAREYIEHHNKESDWIRLNERFYYGKTWYDQSQSEE